MIKQKLPGRMVVYALGTVYRLINTECGVVIKIIYGTDTNDWSKDVTIYVSDV